MNLYNTTQFLFQFTTLITLSPPLQIDGKQVIPSGALLAAARGAVDAWAGMAGCPALLLPRAAFVSAELDGNASLFFALDYQPGAYTLAQVSRWQQSFTWVPVA